MWNMEFVYNWEQIPDHYPDSHPESSESKAETASNTKPPEYSPPWQRHWAPDHKTDQKWPNLSLHWHWHWESERNPCCRWLQCCNRQCRSDHSKPSHPDSSKPSRICSNGPFLVWYKSSSLDWLNDIGHFRFASWNWKFDLWLRCDIGNSIPEGNSNSPIEWFWFPNGWKRILQCQNLN